jgi:hypothetical protein
VSPSGDEGEDHPFPTPNEARGLLVQSGRELDSIPLPANSTRLMSVPLILESTSKSILKIWLMVAGCWIGSCDGLAQELASSDRGPVVKLDAEKVDFFERNIRPILVAHCYECHASTSGDNSGDLRLDHALGLIKGGARGAAISIEKPIESLLLKAIQYETEDFQMPPAGKLPDEAIQYIKTWLEQGAIDPRVESDKSPQRLEREKAAADHWAFQPLPKNLTSKDTSQLGSSIDRLLSEKRKEVDLVANPSASKRQLIRRLYYDLLGLNPSWPQYQELESQSLENYESWVDSAIASPHFGERMARRWMDVSRYADNKGYVFQEDREYAQAWRYREWLIESFNSDMPFDQFASFQIAADRMDPGPENKNLHAMGFLTLGRRFLNNENDIADDRIDVVTRGFMGLTVTCARCHDHKFDAVGMDDYYSMHAAFVSSKEPKDEPGPLRLVDADKLRPAVILKRGNARTRGDTIPKRFVKFLDKVSRPMDTGSGRIDMAQAIADPNNPLTARVYVNRVWGWLMGAPLVDTPSDFGIRCPAPTQLSLLDTLAAEFVADGWSTKRLVKRIVMSDAYRRSSEMQAEAFAKDPENLLWWRGNRKRMDFESLRDSILVACKQLDTTIGGPSIKMINSPFSDRRTLYAYIDRQNLPGVFRSFDFASPETHVPNRLSTTVPQQGLFMMNSPMLDHYAMEMARRVVDEYRFVETGSPDLMMVKNREMIRELFQSILLREPTESQVQRSIGFLEIDAREPQDASQLPWLDLIKALLCTNELCFVD